MIKRSSYAFSHVDLYLVCDVAVCALKKNPVGLLYHIHVIVTGLEKI